MGAVGPAATWARVEVRRRLRSLIVLGLLAGLTAGLALAAVAGARRTDTAWERLRDRTNAADAIVFTSQAGIYDPDELDYDSLADRPYIDAVGAFGLVWGTSDLGPFGAMVSTYGGWLTSVDTPRIIEGRLPARDAPNEVVISPPLPGSEMAVAGIRVGSTIGVSFLTVEQQAAGRFEPPEGPTVELEVVGIADSPFNLAAIPSDGDIYIGPAFRERYGDGLFPFSNLVVRLRDQADMKRLEADVAAAYPGRGVPVYDLITAGKRVTNATSLERSGLLLFALAVAVSGVVIVGQALTRSVRSAAGDVPTLRALGFSRGDAMRALLLSHAPAAAVAVVTAIIAAVALSARFPIGMGRRLETERGPYLDLPVVLGGATALAAVLAAAIMLTARRAAKERQGTNNERVSTVAERLRRSGAPVPLSIGAGLAFEAGRGARTLPTRPAVAGAIVGVLGVVGAFTLSDGLHDAIANAERFGAVWDADVYFGGDGPGESMLQMAPVLSADPDVSDAVRLARITIPIDDVVMPTYAVEDAKGSIRFVLLEGRAPGRAGDVVLGPDSAATLDVGIGDRVTVGEIDDMLIVGIGLLPTTAHSSFDQGAWLLPDDLSRAIGDEQRSAFRNELAQYGVPADTPDEELPFFGGGMLLRLAESANQADAIERLGSALPGVVVEAAAGPADQQNLRNVRQLPALFSVFASVLAIAAIGHVSASVIRRRRGDLAVLRALGCTPRQARWSVVWQAMSLAVVGLVVGVPLGLVGGRVIWRAVTDATPMIYVAPVAVVALALTVPAALLGANALAAWPARQAARLRPAEVLRTE